MTQTQPRTEIKKAVDLSPEDRLASLADYLALVSCPDFEERIENAEQDIKAGRGFNWRKVRNSFSLRSSTVETPKPLSLTRSLDADD